VHLEGELSEIGTLELACVERGAGARRFELSFGLRGERRESVAPKRPSIPAKRATEASTLLAKVFGKSNEVPSAREVKDLHRDLEQVLGERTTWTSDTARSLFDELVPLARGRRRSPEHERQFWALAGFTLRPGFGYFGDEARAKEIASLVGEGLTHGKEQRVWQQALVAWRRIAGGLDEARQLTLRDLLDPFVVRRAR
jgi:hypothetical protein